MEFDSVIEIPLDRLQVSRMQVRVRDIEKDLEDLVDNIRTHGQLEPIVVARIPNTDRYEIITGQRRFLAVYRRAGVPVAVLGVDQVGPFSRWRRELERAGRPVRTRPGDDRVARETTTQV